MLEARNQAPPLVVELPVHAALLLATVATSVLAIERMLLAGIDAADDPTQKHQHSDLTLQIVHKDELVQRDCSQVVNTDVVIRYTEPRPQTDRLSQRISWRGDFLRPAATSMSTSANRRMAEMGHESLFAPSAISISLTRISGARVSAAEAPKTLP